MEPLTYDEMCNQMKNILFGYDNIDDKIKNNIYNEIVEQYGYAYDEGTKLISEMLGIDEKTLDDIEKICESNESNEDFKENIIEFIVEIIKFKFKDKDLKKDGYCLKLNLLHKAVQFKHDENMLGFISDLDDETTRFVFVDFGDKDGPVKMDFDDLIY